MFADGYEDACPEGFILDQSYCTGMLPSCFNNPMSLWTFVGAPDCCDDEVCPELDEDECALQSPCSHSCNNIMGGFFCACPSGFIISTESDMCQGQTERQTAASMCSMISCAHKISFFSLSLYRVDIDECLQGLHMCHYNQQCVNTVGAYRCQAKCGAGFKASVTGTGCEGKLPVIQSQSVLSEMIKMNPHFLLLGDALLAGLMQHIAFNTCI